MSLRRLEAAELHVLEPLIASYRFKPYRHYRILSRRRQDAVMTAEIDATLRSCDGIVLYASAPHEAAVVLKKLPWDSDFFGVPMARLDYVLRADTNERHGLDDVLQGASDVCRSEAVAHVTARIDVGDTLAIAALEDHGYRLMDALVSYIHRPKDPPPRDVKLMGVVRPFRDEDTSQIMEIAHESYRGFRGRFHLDPHLPNERCDALYLEWARQSCARRMADEVLVTDNGNGELLGFVAFRRREPVSTVGGTPIIGSGLGAVRRATPGAYMGLIREGIVWATTRAWVAEGQTQNYNFPVVRVYESIGGMYVRAEYTFHAWFGAT